MKVLLVDDEARVREGLERMLPQLWNHDDDEPLDLVAADSGPAALTEMERGPADLVLTDMRMPFMDGATLLEKVHARWPAAMRVVLSGYMEDDAAVRSAPHAHQYLAKPCPPAALADVLDRAFSLSRILASEHARAVLGSLGTLPAAPKIYLQLRRRLDAGEADLRPIARLVESDPALTAKTLQLVNSAFFARSAPVSSVSEAIARIGLRTLQILAASTALFSTVSDGLSLQFVEATQQHAARVAIAARELGGPEAFLPGMLCDVGLLVLHASRLGEHEASIAAHPMVGAYLLTLWGFPHDAVNVVMRHHEEPPPDADPVMIAVSYAARWIDGELDDAQLRARFGRLPALPVGP